MGTAAAVGFSCLFLGMSLVDISVMSFVLQNEKIDGARMLLVRQGGRPTRSHFARTRQ